MKLIECNPKSQFVSKYVDRYQFYDIEEPSYLKTIPNGKIECWFIIDGGFEILDVERNEFVTAKKYGAFPASNQFSILRIPNKLVCLNIKMNLDVLGFNKFNDFCSDFKKLSSEFLFSKRILENIQGLDFISKKGVDVVCIDNWLTPFFLDKNENPEISEILVHLDQLNDLTVAQLAKKMNMSTKTLERITKKYFNLTPRDFWNIIRFERTTAHLKENKTKKFIDALSFGYYDQSHFIKECKRITGTTPKNLFAKMKLPTNDLMVNKKNFK